MMSIVSRIKGICALLDAWWTRRRVQKCQDMLDALFLRDYTPAEQEQIIDGIDNVERKQHLRRLKYQAQSKA